MNAQENIKRIFATALEQESPAEREKYLAEACKNEPEWRRLMVSLHSTRRCPLCFQSDLNGARRE